MTREIVRQKMLASDTFLDGVVGHLELEAVCAARERPLPRTVNAAVPEYLEPSNQRVAGDSRHILYIHGIGLTLPTLDQHITMLSYCFGAPVTAVVHAADQPLCAFDSRGAARGVRNGTVGILSPVWGTQSEATAVLTAARTIERLVFEEKKQLHVVAHSQGAIILANALTNLLGPDSHLNEEQRSALSKQITVITMGGGEHSFPTGVSVHACAHTSDPVVRITRPVTRIRDSIGAGIQWLLKKADDQLSSTHPARAYLPAPREGEGTQHAPTIFLKGDHSLQSYLENYDRFYVERYRDKDERIDSTRLAHDLLHSIQSGGMSDGLHARIIRNRIAAQDGEFCRGIQDHATEQGTIDEFQIPFRELVAWVAQYRDPARN
jgi:hypothetical protein